MIILPAIDLFGHKAVRLLKGDYRNMTVYSDDPLAVARDFEEKGASRVHLVDLEGAKNGTTPHADVVRAVTENTSLKVEIGGGIRDMKTVETYLSAGVERVILGTAAVEDRAFLRKVSERFGEKIAVGADIRDGRIAVKGWLETSSLTTDAFLDELEEIGIRTVICTDISKDGAMKGTNLSLYEALSRRKSLRVIASGGVSSLDDVKALARLDLYGAIIGKAYYTGAVDLREAIEVAK